MFLKRIIPIYILYVTESTIEKHYNNRFLVQKDFVIDNMLKAHRVLSV